MALVAFVAGITFDKLTRWGPQPIGINRVVWDPYKWPYKLGNLGF